MTGKVVFHKNCQKIPLPLSSAQDTHLPAQKKSQPRQDVPMKKKLHCRSRTSKKEKSLPPHGNPIKNIKHHD